MRCYGQAREIAIATAQLLQVAMAEGEDGHYFVIQRSGVETWSCSTFLAPSPPSTARSEARYKKRLTAAAIVCLVQSTHLRVSPSSYTPSAIAIDSRLVVG